MILEEKIDNKFEKLKFNSNIGLKILNDHRNTSLKKKLKKKILSHWLRYPRNRNYVKYRFLIFIFTIFNKNSGSNFYMEQLKEIYLNKSKNFYICFEHLVISDPLLSIWVTDEPEEIFKIFKYTCEEILKDMFQQNDRKFNIWIKIYGLPICEPIRNLKKKKPNCLVKVRGYVTSKTHVFPTIAFFRLTCLKCFETQNSLFSTIDQKNKKIKSCFNCKSLGPFKIKWNKLITSQFQKISIREELKNDPYFSLPCSIEIILTGDLIDQVDYGDKMEITGILKYSILQNLNLGIKNPVFFPLIEGNFIQKIENLTTPLKISTLETQILENVINEQRLLTCLLYSAVPHIFQNYFLKLLILLAFCSTGRKCSSSNEINHESLNILLIGEHCSGKSTILKSILNFFPQTQLFSGQGTSIKGLTTFLKHDKIIGEWVPEGGLLAMARDGLSLIDGIEEIAPKNLKTLCKILDQQYIVLKQKFSSIKIPATNPIIATMNYTGRIGNPALPFFLNNGVNEFLISKFDIIFETRKMKTFKSEKNLAKFILNKFKKTNSKKNKNIFNGSNQIYRFKETEHLTDRFIMRYLNYCKNNFKPKYRVLDQSFILRFYLDLKRETRALNSIGFSASFFETIIKIISASAKIHLRNQISEKDLAIGLLVFFETWIQIQPFFTKNFLKTKYKNFFGNIFKKYDDCLIFLKNM